MALDSNKINIYISSLSFEEIYALLDDIGSDYEEESDNLMADTDTKFADRTAIENSEKDISEPVIHEKDDSNDNNLILATKPIEAAVKIAKPDSESEDDGDDVPLRNLAGKKDVV